MKDDGTLAALVAERTRELEHELAECKRMVEALRESEEKYRILVENAGEAVFVVQKGIFKFVNAKAVAMIGCPKEELIGWPFVDHIHADDRGLVLDRYTKRLHGVEAISAYSFRIARRSGETLWVALSVVKIEWNGEAATLNFLRDITEEKRAEEELSRAKNDLERFFKLVPDLVAVASIDGYFKRLNPEWEKTLGYSVQELLSEPYESFIHPDDIAPTRIEVNRQMQGNKTIRFENRYRHKDGSYRWLEWNGTPALCDLLFAAARDITGRKRADEALAALSSRQEAMLAAVPEIIMEVDKHKVYVWANWAGLAFFGDDVIGKEAAFYFEGEQATYQTIQPLFDGHQDVTNVESWQRRKDGEKRLLAWRCRVLKDESGKVIGALSSARDITERKRAEEALRESEERFRQLTETMPDAVLVGQDGRNVYANPAAARLFRAAGPEVLVGLDVFVVIDPARHERAREQMQRILAGEKQPPFEDQFIRLDGSLVPVEIAVSLLMWQGRPAQQVIVRDITERKKLEERLRQSQKMEGIGHLAGGMAHEFNNILAAMMMHLSLVQMYSAGVEARDLLNEMESLCRRAADLIGKLLAFSRQSVMQPQSMDLAEVVSRQVKILERLLGEGITLEFSSTDRLPWVKADKAMIEQVLLNLCLNARDAMKSSGLLRLGLAEAELGAEQAKAHDHAQPGRYVCLSVADTGCGMDEGTIKRLFEPFFTTKDVGQGTGLGLATVQGIVQQHHGWIEVQSCVGKGSTFRVYLPAVDQPLAAPPVSRKETSVRGRGTILIVEDEPSLRKPTGKVLVRAGYVVLEAADGREALAVWDVHRAEIDLVYTDMVMPGDLTGLQLAERVLADKPGVKVIITSGYNTDLRDLAKASEASIVYLPKPCPAATLTSVIQECLKQV